MTYKCFFSQVGMHQSRISLTGAYSPSWGFLLVASVPRTNYYFTVLGFCHASTILPRLQGFAMLGTDCVFENKHTLVTYSVYLHKSYRLSNVSLFQGFAMLARTTCFEINTYLHSTTVLSGWRFCHAWQGTVCHAWQGPRRWRNGDDSGFVVWEDSLWAPGVCEGSEWNHIPIACISKYVIERTMAKCKLYQQITRHFWQKEWENIFALGVCLSNFEYDMITI